jgi:hypothetical protein
MSRTSKTFIMDDDKKLASKPPKVLAPKKALSPGFAEERYRETLSNLGAVQTFFPLAAKEQMAKLFEESARRSNHFVEIASKQHNSAIKGGFAAEEVLAETRNCDAILKGKTNRAFTDSDPQFPKKINDPSSDICVVESDGTVTHSSQVKIYKKSETSRDQMGLLDPETRQPKYQNEDSYIGSSDQVNPKNGGKSIADAAREKAMREAEKRPEIAESMKAVEKKVTDRLAPGDGTESKTHTKKQYEDLGEQNEKGREIRDDYLNDYHKQSTLQQMSKAAQGAAAIAAVSAGIYNTLRYTQAVRDGRMTVNEAALKIVGETGAAATDCAVKAAANTGVQSLIVRHGGEKMVKTVMLKSFGGLMKTSAITVAVIASIDLTKNLVLLAAGKISKSEFEERSGKSVINTGAGVYGGAIGATIGTPFFPPFGTYVGSVLGAMATGFAMQFVIENGIEKEFRETIEDTAQVKEAMATFQAAAGNIFSGQIMFERYLQLEAELNLQFQDAGIRLDTAGKDMKSAIDRL